VPHRDGSDNVFGNGFTAWSASTAALRKRAGKLPPWSLHDIRRSAATHMAEIGIQPHIIEAVLNHVSGHKGGVAGIYNLATYRVDVAKALLHWSEHLSAVVTGRKAKVVPMKRA
jgi:integrase